METGRIIGTMLVVCIIGPAFWLGVQVLEAKFWLFVRQKRSAKQAARADGRLPQKLP